MTDSVVSFTAANTGVSGQGFINRFGGVTAQLARWEVTSLAGAGLNIGSMEMRFLGTAPALFSLATLALTFRRRL